MLCMLQFLKNTKKIHLLTAAAKIQQGLRHQKGVSDSFSAFLSTFIRLETSTDKTLADSEKSLSRLTEFLASDHEFETVRSEVQKNLDYVRKETDGAVRSQQTEQVKQQLTVCLPEMYIYCN